MSLLLRSAATCFTLIVLAPQWQGCMSTAQQPKAPEQQLSALDRLHQRDIPPADQFDGQPKELVAILGEQRQRQWAAVRRLAYSPDGKWLASAGNDRAVRIWDTRTMQPVAVLIHPATNWPLYVSPVFRHAGTVWAVAFSPDGKYLATGDHSGAAYLWDAKHLTTAKPQILKNQTPFAVSSLAFSSDSKLLVTGPMYNTYWDLTEKQPREVKGPVVGGDRGGLAFLPRTRTLLALSADTLCVWNLEDLNNPREVARLRDSQARNPPRIHHLSVSPDGKRVAINFDLSLVVYDVQPQGSLKQHYGNIPCSPAFNSYNASAFSPDGKLLAVCGNWPANPPKRTAQRFCVLDISGEDPKLVAELEGHSGDVTHLAFSPDGKTLASASEDGTIRFWEPVRGKWAERNPLRGQASPVNVIAFSPKADVLAAGYDDGAIRFWNFHDRKTPEPALFQTSQAPVTAMAFSPDGSVLAAGGSRFNDPPPLKLQLWDTKQKPFRLRANVPLIPGGLSTTTLAFHPDGKRLFSGHEGGNDAAVLHDWDVTASPARILQSSRRGRGYGFPVRLINCTPDGSYLVLVNGDQVQLMSSQHWGGFGPYPTYIDPGRRVKLHSVMLSPDGKCLAVGAGDGKVQLFDWKLGTAGPAPELKSTFDEHNTDVTAVVFSPDSKTLVSADFSGTVVVRDTARRKVLARWQFAGPVHGVSFAWDGRQIATTNGNGTVYILRLTDLLKKEQKP